MEPFQFRQYDVLWIYMKRADCFVILFFPKTIYVVNFVAIEVKTTLYTGTIGGQGWGIMGGNIHQPTHPRTSKKEIPPRQTTYVLLFPLPTGWPPERAEKMTVFTCGRRPAGHVMMSVVGVVVVVVGGGGGEQLLCMGSPTEPMYGLIEFKSKTPFLFEFFFQKPMYGLSAHVWWAQGEGGPSSF